MEMSETTDSGPLSPLLDDASADVTSQLPAADRTVSDLEALTPETAGAALEARDVADAADATGEIEALDILEVADVLRASRIPAPRVAQPPSDAVHASSVPVAPPSSRALEVLETSRLPAVMIAPQAHASSSVGMPVAAPHGHPSSIAPLAVDVTPAPRGSYASAARYTPTPPDPRESTVEIARAAGIPSRASRIVVYTASVTGMCLVAGILGVMLGYSHGPASKSKPPSLAAPGPVTTAVTPPVATPGVAVPRVPVVTGAHEEITEGPILVPAKDAASMLEIADDGAATATPAPAAAPVAVPTPLVVPAPAPRSAPAAPAVRSTTTTSGNASSTTGVLRLPPSVSGVLIDGVPHKAGGGGLVVSCGRHAVKAPGHPSRLVIIPCGGSAAL